MIIESERENPVDETERHPYFRQGPLATIFDEENENQQIHVPASWATYLAMRQKIRDPHIHQQWQKDLVEHLWRRKGEV